jgi:hypothetical protein
MKYVVMVETRLNGTPSENMEALKNVQEVFAKWTPPEGVTLEFHERLDGEGTFVVADGDDVEAMFLPALQFSPWVKSTFYPVTDVERGTALAQKAIDWHDSL